MDAINDTEILLVMSALDSQFAIITVLQGKLRDAIASGDWSVTEQWNKNLAIAGDVFGKLITQEEIMSLKDKIDTLTAAITDRDKQIEQLKQNQTELQDAEAAADKAISDLKLTPPNSTTPATPVVAAQ
ncbi:hypothetical protein G7B40_001455 [Aetokthonos hydrillicola Thurmond2011]|jgi:hypothetical protein|uniref:Uncharacterized protein n=1 Tax=Aetokthonos hydrillicola Thurmond2011 TaxID=2712845 RepID=A0AAP5M719_9CYAN|nr:hypothetical protein [Aetokthonos hydrillicola]MBO3463131.1 hypothetical protein [Aetokthonos hydrillicola CCALA 1050]MBW4591085.1 hypothetical protein [Aetokthonos hydrillicola CCALA 1050]MDR9893252.1 hypothetical protein [Aetokthonos hydrillicola Thurmond2011]